jgi:hypothetical protein
VLKLISTKNIQTEPPKLIKKPRRSSIRPPNLCQVHITVVRTVFQENANTVYEIKRVKSNITHSHDLDTSDQWKVLEFPSFIV